MLHFVSVKVLKQCYKVIKVRLPCNEIARPFFVTLRPNDRGRLCPTVAQQQNESLEKMIKALIFDMDGTIVDNIPYHFDAWLKFLANHGIHMNPNDFHAQNHGKIKEMIVRLLGSHLSEEEIIALGKEKELTYRDLYKDHIKEVKGLTTLLTEAKNKNLKIALATMGDTENINFIIDGLNVRHFFDVIVGGNDVEKGKPDPEIFNLALNKLGVSPDEALVFEDSHGGVMAAQGANIAVVGITTTDSPISFNEWGVKKTISNFDEFSLMKTL